jgi:hypothetical protein
MNFGDPIFKAAPPGLARINGGENGFLCQFLAGRRSNGKLKLGRQYLGESKVGVNLGCKINLKLLSCGNVGWIHTNLQPGREQPMRSKVLIRILNEDHSSLSKTHQFYTYSWSPQHPGRVR